MPKAPAFKIPNLDNATPGFLIDEMGKIAKRQGFLKKLKGVYREAFLAKIKPSDYLINPKGERFEADISVTTPQRLDQAKVKALLTEEQWNSCLNDKEQTTVRFKLLGSGDEFVVIGEEEAEGLPWDEI